MAVDKKVLEGRRAIDAYRSGHDNMYQTAKTREAIKDGHNALYGTLIAALTKQEYKTIDEFFAASESANLAEMGVASKEELTAEQFAELDRMWK